MKIFKIRISTNGQKLENKNSVFMKSCSPFLHWSTFSDSNSFMTVGTYFPRVMSFS